MNSDQLKGHWTELVGQVRQHWGELNEDEVQQTKGDREQMIGQIQKKYGKTREEAEREFDKFVAGL
jgi:uncharacterized protein YjbJ (UPF0337 family)